MITKNKLTHQPENKLTKKFQPIDLGSDDFTGKPSKNHEKSKKRTNKRKMVILLPVLMLLVAGMTFGVIWLVAGRNKNTDETAQESNSSDSEPSESESEENQPAENESEGPNPETEMDEQTASIQPITNAESANPTIKYGRLMLINPNFMVETSFITNRKGELISLEGTYGIKELHSYNGDNLLDKEAAKQLNQMLADYTIAYPGHTIQTVSCFREVGTSCGRLCAATGASDHHTGLTCDLIDPMNGDSLDTDTYDQHQEWQWLKANSYKYGFIDRFPEAWAGGPMSEPVNVNAEGSTGLFETWHYRYVGIFAATEIATGVYNNGEYDSLEHYLKARGLVTDLLNGH